MASSNTPNQISLKIVVDKEKNRVFFAKAGKEFMDIVLSFLTMPLGTIARLVRKDSNLKGVTFGCITSLYQSVENLDPNYFNTDTCKQMLLHPRNPMESHSRNLKLNIDDTEPTNYYVCYNDKCRNSSFREEEAKLSVATFRNQRCECGRIMLNKIGIDPSFSEGQTSEGYVEEFTTFVIFDNLSVKTWDRCTPLELIDYHGNESAPQYLTVNLSLNEVVDLLKCSLLSNSPLTEFFLPKKQNLHLEKSIAEPSCFVKQETTAEDNKVVKLKLTLTKSKSKILFAHVEEDFIDLLFSFLTLPLGAVVHVLHGNSGLECFDKLYKSMVELNAKHFESEELKNKLINLPVAPYFKVNNSILPIGDVEHPSYSCNIRKYSYRSNLDSMILTAAQGSSRKVSKKHWGYEESTPVTFLDPKVPSKKRKINNGGGYVNRCSTFMVSDELVVTPFSFSSVVPFIDDLEMKKHDMKETIHWSERGFEHSESFYNFTFVGFDNWVGSLHKVYQRRADNLML